MTATSHINCPCCSETATVTRCQDGSSQIAWSCKCTHDAALWSRLQPYPFPHDNGPSEDDDPPPALAVVMMTAKEARTATSLSLARLAAEQKRRDAETMTKTVPLLNDAIEQATSLGLAYINVFNDSAADFHVWKVGKSINVRVPTGLQVVKDYLSTHPFNYSVVMSGNASMVVKWDDTTVTVA